MSARVVIEIAALGCIAICGLISTLANWEMVDKVNAKLPKEEQFAALWWGGSKFMRLHREYKRLYPDGSLLLGVRALTVLMIVCLLVCAWEFGFFTK
jgi:hypothetical protein